MISACFCSHILCLMDCVSTKLKHGIPPAEKSATTSFKIPTRLSIPTRIGGAVTTLWASGTRLPVPVSRFYKFDEFRYGFPSMLNSGGLVRISNPEHPDNVYVSSGRGCTVIPSGSGTFHNQGNITYIGDIASALHSARLAILLIFTLNVVIYRIDGKKIVYSFSGEYLLILFHHSDFLKLKFYLLISNPFRFFVCLNEFIFAKNNSKTVFD